MKPRLVNIHVLVFFVAILVGTSDVQSQVSNPPDVPYNQQRLKSVVVIESVATIAAFTGLYYLWYRKYPRSRFHFFNDNNEWLNMDKAGHATTAYNISAVQYNLMRWCGVDKHQSILIGGLTAIGFQTIIEIFDGFSEKWGFSYGDMLSNVSGAAIFMGQQSGWDDQRMRLKFSYHYTMFPQYNPDELGRNFFQRLLKDYNGQTYWLSISPASFMSSETSFPKWLNLAFGYGATGMTGATHNPNVVNGTAIPPFDRYRRYFISPDIDLSHAVSNHPSDQLLISVPAIIKFPAPTVEFSKKAHTKFYPLYF
jgi:hypothetical protein